MAFIRGLTAMDFDAGQYRLPDDRSLPWWVVQLAGGD